MTALQERRDGDALAFGPFTLRPGQRRLIAGSKTVKIGSRALDLLIHLVSRAGEVVGHRELTAHAWAGSQVEESNLRFQIGQLRKALAEHSDGAEYIASVPGRGYCFTGSLDPGAPTIGERVAASTAHAALLASLPPPPDGIVGRGDDVAAVSERLSLHRLATLVGPGGVGKTTVAIAAAHRVIADGAGATAVFVDLTALDDASLVASAVATALGMAVGRANPLPQIVSLLAEREVLLVVDNCEHVVDEAAVVVTGILAGTARARVLATSREPLRIAGESVLHLPPLALPALDEADVLSFPAMQLFAARARLQVPGLALDGPAAGLAAEICRELDGLPLAIELVAARVGSLGLSGIADLVRAGYSGSGLGRRATPARHRTLQATFEWSYALLSAGEAGMLRALAIFTGPFSREAALAAAGLTPAQVHEGIDLLASLAEKCRVVTEFGTGPVRYRLLQTTRHYALRKLGEAGDLAAVSRRHAAFYAADLEQAVSVRRARPDRDGVAEASRHVSNVRTALGWCFGPDGDRSLGVRLAAVAAPVFLHLSLLAECDAWTAQAETVPEFAALDPWLALELMAARCVALRYTKGNTDEVRRAILDALDLAERLDDAAYRIRLVEALAVFYMRVACFGEAMTHALRGRTGDGATSMAPGFATGDWLVGVLDHFGGQPAEARRRCELALRMFPVERRPEVARFGIDQRMLAQSARTRALWVLGHPDQAVAAADEMLRETEGLRRPVLLCIALVWAASVLLWAGDLGRAADAIQAIETLSAQHSLVPYHHLGRGLRGRLEILRGEAEHGIALIRESLPRLADVRQMTMSSALQLELAEALLEAGQSDEALAQLAEAARRIERDEETTLLPELWRVRGLALSSLGETGWAQAEEALRTAMRIADEQGARSWQLRAATDFARLLTAAGRHDEAAEVLSGVHAAFAEGFGTRDLRRAARLLDEIAAATADH